MGFVTTRWKGGSGDWGGASNWSNGAPNTGSAAVVDAKGTYTVTIAQGAAFAAGSVDLAAASATLSLQGSLTVTTGFDLAAGTLALNFSGVLAGGSLTFDGGALASQGGTFDHMKAVGPMLLAGDFQTLIFTHGFSVTAVGGGAGQILLNGEDDTLTFRGNQTFDNATIVMSGNGTSIFGGIIDCTGVLTLGPHATVTTVGTQTQEILAGSTIVNQGTINSAAGSFFGIEISPEAFVNQGLITADNLVIAGGKTFANAASGVIDIGSGENFVVKGSFHNVGTIAVGAGADLELQGEYALSDLGAIQNSGQVSLMGTLQNAGQVLTLGDGPLAGSVSITGTILGGIVRPGSNPAQAVGATLDGVTWQGLLALDSQFSSLTIKNGLTLTGAGGTGPGIVTIDGSGAVLLFSGNQTFDNATVDLGAGQSGDSLSLILGRKGVSTTLTLGPNLLVESTQAGSRAAIDKPLGAAAGPGAVVNDGRIVAAASAGQFLILVDTFVNAGTISASNGDQLSIDAQSLTNTGAISVSGGASLDVFVGTTESVGFFTNAGQINIGARSTFTLVAHATVASLGNLVDKGAFVLAASLDAGGQSVKLGRGPIFGGQSLTLELGGFLQHGTFNLGKAAITYQGGGFGFATIHGAVNLSAASATVEFGGGVVLTRANGLGPGLVNLTGAGAALAFFDPKGVNANAIDNVTITIGNATTAAHLQIVSEASRAQTFTLGSGVKIVSGAAGALAAFDSQFGFADTLVNQGLISAAASGGTFTIAEALVNTGQIDVSNGDTLILQAALYGSGQAAIASGSVLEIGRSAAVGQTVVFQDATGLLRLDAGASFAATLVGLRVGDAVELVATAATSASVNNQDQLVVLNGSSTVATLQLTGYYRHTIFQVASDGHGGTNISVSTTAAAPAFAQAIASPPAAATVAASHRFIAAIAALGGSADTAIHTHDAAALHPPMLLGPGVSVA